MENGNHENQEWFELTNNSTFLANAVREVLAPRRTVRVSGTQTLVSLPPGSEDWLAQNSGPYRFTYRRASAPTVTVRALCGTELMTRQAKGGHTAKCRACQRIRGAPQKPKPVFGTDIPQPKKTRSSVQAEITQKARAGNAQNADAPVSVQHEKTDAQALIVDLEAKREKALQVGERYDTAIATLRALIAGDEALEQLQAELNEHKRLIAIWAKE